MKRFVLVGVIGMLSLASCKKNRTCQCLYTDGDTEDYFVVNENLKGAKNICDAKSNSSKTCEIKN